MAYVGIGYSGENTTFLRDLADEHMAWLKADRLPRFFGDGFMVLYDSNIAREFIRKCREQAEPRALSVYPMDRPYEY